MKQNYFTENRLLYLPHTRDIKLLRVGNIRNEKGLIDCNQNIYLYSGFMIKRHIPYNHYLKSPLVT